MYNIIHLWRKRQKKVPIVRQISQNECGPACLVMLFGYYGHSIPLHLMTEECQAYRNGTNALTLKQAAQKYGYELKAFRVEQMEHLKSLDLPVMIHWNHNHYMILEDWTSQGVRLVDPADGRKVLTEEEFKQSYSGITMTVTPTKPQKAEEVKNTSGWRIFFRYAWMTPKLTLVLLALSILVQIIGATVPLLVGYLIDRYLGNWNVSLYTTTILVILAIFLVFFLLSYIRSIVFAQLQRHISATLSRDFLAQLLQLPLKFFEQRNTGDLATRMSNVSVIREILSTSGVAVILDLTMLVIYSVVMLFYSVHLSLITYGLGLLQLGIMLVFIPMIRKHSQQELSAQATSQSYLIESLRGSMLIKAMSREDTVLRTWLETYSEQMKHFVIRFMRSGLLNSIVGSLTQVIPLVLLIIGFLEIQQGNMTIGTLVAFSSLAMSFLSPINSLITYVQSFQILISVIERLQDVLHSEPDRTLERTEEKRKLDLRRTTIRLEHVGFSYDRNDNTLRDITITIPPGTKLALVGPTGSGKSTIVKLLMGLYHPTSGRIRYGEHMAEEVDFRHLRRQIGVVLQDTQLFNDSIAKNISFFDKVPMEAIQQAAELACLSNDVSRMPLGYHTHIGENGQNLSGGQRQRLAIARALVFQPAILILDEATSHLDSLTEEQLNQNFRKHRITQVVIAHRLSTITDADQIVVLHDGQMDGIGSHQELLSSNTLYRNLWTKQQSLSIPVT